MIDCSMCMPDYPEDAIVAEHEVPAGEANPIALNFGSSNIYAARPSAVDGYEVLSYYVRVNIAGPAIALSV
jgi:hypothetical protein